MRIKGKKYDRVKPLTEERKKLVEQYIPKALKIAEYYNKIVPRFREDNRSQALFSLVQAGSTYKETKSKFVTYLSFRVSRDISKVKELRNRDKLSLFSKAEESGTVLLSLPPLDPQQEVEDWDYMESLVKKVPKTLREVFRLKLLYGKDFNEIAVLLNKSQSEISRIYRTGLVFLKHELGKS